MTYDNGLTKEQQKIVDARYEELMAQLKEVFPQYHKQLMKELEEINSDKLLSTIKKVSTTNQLQLFNFEELKRQSV